MLRRTIIPNIGTTSTSSSATMMGTGAAPLSPRSLGRQQQSLFVALVQQQGRFASTRAADDGVSSMSMGKNNTNTSSLAGNPRLPLHLRHHYDALKRRQDICPHLFLIRKPYDGKATREADAIGGRRGANGTTTIGSSNGTDTNTTNAVSMIDLLGSSGIQKPYYKQQQQQALSHNNNSSGSHPAAPLRVEQQCELCGKCRVLDHASLRHSPYLQQKLLCLTQPQLGDIIAEEPWVDVSYNVHGGLKAMDLFVKGEGGGGGNDDSSSSVAATTTTAQTNPSASSESSSMVTRFLTSATAAVSSKAMYKLAEAKRQQSEAEEGLARLEVMDGEESKEAATATKNGQGNDTDEKTKSDRSSESTTASRAQSSSSSGAVDGPPPPYPYASPAKKPLLTPLDVYKYVPHYKNMASAHPQIPFQRHVATIPQFLKYFGSVAKKEVLSNYLTKETERELGFFEHGGDDDQKKNEGRKKVATTTASKIKAALRNREAYSLFHHPKSSSTECQPNRQKADQNQQEEERGGVGGAAAKSSSSSSCAHSVHPSDGTSVIDKPSLPFIQSSLRAMKFSAVVYGTAYEGHFFDTVLRVGKVRSFLEIYQSSHESQLAAARRMATAEIGPLPPNSVWSTKEQCYLDPPPCTPSSSSSPSATASGADSPSATTATAAIPAVEIIEGNWTNLPWGLTYVLAVDHQHKEITLAFRGTFADAGIVVDIHNFPLSLLTLEEERRTGIRRGGGGGGDNTNESSSSTAAKTTNSTSEDASSSPSSSSSFYTSPFGFLYNVKPGSPQSQALDKALLRLALVDYPRYKVVFTGHSLGAACASNFPASRLMMGVLGQEGGLYGDGDVANGGSKNKIGRGNSQPRGEKDAQLQSLWAEVRECVLECEHKKEEDGDKHCELPPPRYNARLAHIIDNVIDFSDPFQIAGLYMNAFITRSPSSSSSSTASYTSTIEDRFIICSFAPPASVNMKWRSDLAQHFPCLDWRSFVHDTDVVTRLQVTTLRIMAEVINSRQIIPNVLQRGVATVLGTVGGGFAFNATAAASGMPNLSAEAPVYERIHRHLGEAIASASATNNSGASILGNGGNGVEESTPPTEVIAKPTADAPQASNEPVETSASTTEASSSTDQQQTIGGTPIAAFTASCPTEQLQNLDDLQTCFLTTATATTPETPTAAPSSSASTDANDQQPSAPLLMPRCDNADNFWVPLGNIYLLGRAGQSMNSYPVKGDTRPIEAVLSAVAADDKKEERGGGETAGPHPTNAMSLAEYTKAITEELFDAPLSPVSPSTAAREMDGGTAAATEGIWAPFGFPPFNTASSSSSAYPQPFYDIPDSSFDIATAFNTYRRPSSMALVGDPLASAGLVVPTVDLRSAHNHFLFRYGRAILDLGLSAAEEKQGEDNGVSSPK